MPGSLLRLPDLRGVALAGFEFLFGVRKLRSAPEDRFHARDRFHALLGGFRKLQDVTVDSVINDKNFHRVFSLGLVMVVVRVGVGIRRHSATEETSRMLTSRVYSTREE